MARPLYDSKVTIHVNRFSHDEFQLSLRWTPRVNGVTPATPGFYVKAMYANEGTAHGVVKGSWEQRHGGPGSLASDDFMVRLFELLDENGMLEPGFNGLTGVTLANFAFERQQEALEAKRARLDRLKAEVAELEAECGQ